MTSGYSYKITNYSKLYMSVKNVYTVCSIRNVLSCDMIEIKISLLLLVATQKHVIVHISEGIVEYIIIIK